MPAKADAAGGGGPEAKEKPVSEANAAQKEFWSTDVAGRFLAHRAVIDAAFAPVQTALLDAAQLAPGQAVLDVGCGAGASTLAAADLVEPGGTVLGLDISPTFLERAREISEGNPAVRFQLDDAQDADLPNAAFDRMISRFGVMFFADSTAAFANIAGSLKPDGRLAFACWGQVRANPWFTLPHHVAAARLGDPPRSDRDAPGPFAFRNPERIAGRLRDAGLTDICVDVIHPRLAAQVPLDVLADTICETGPANGLIHHFNGTAEDRAAIRGEIQRQLQDIAVREGPGLGAEINLVTASVG